MIEKFKGEKSGIGHYILRVSLLLKRWGSLDCTQLRSLMKKPVANFRKHTSRLGRFISQAPTDLKDLGRAPWSQGSGGHGAL